MGRVRGEAWSWRAARSMGRRRGRRVRTDGVVFKVNTDGSGYAVLKSFTGSDGALPYASLVLAGSTLYGTTQQGGDWSCPSFPNGAGVVFQVNTDGSGYTVLKNFTGSDGIGPVAGLVLAGNTLYGTTPNGGSMYSTNCIGIGVVFKVNTDGSGYAVLKSFTGSDGDVPLAGLVLAGSTLYGTTQLGGSWRGVNQGYGVVFKVNTDGSGYAVLKSFTGSDGSEPVWRAWSWSGSTLYGTTYWWRQLGSWRGLQGEHGRVGLRGAQELHWQRWRRSRRRAWSWRAARSMGRRYRGGTSDHGVVFSLACLPIHRHP